MGPLPPPVLRKAALSAQFRARMGLLIGGLALAVGDGTMGPRWFILLPLAFGITPALFREDDKRTWPFCAGGYWLAIAISLVLIAVWRGSRFGYLREVMWSTREQAAYVIFHVVAAGLCTGAASVLVEVSRRSDGNDASPANGAVIASGTLAVAATLAAVVPALASGAYSAFVAIAPCGLLAGIVLRGGVRRERQRLEWLRAVVDGEVPGYVATQSDPTQGDASHVPPLLYRNSRAREATYSLIVAAAGPRGGGYREDPVRPNIEREIGSLPSDFATNPLYLSTSADFASHALCLAFKGMLMSVVIVLLIAGAA